MSEEIRRRSPNFSLDEAIQIARTNYSLTNFVGHLSSERDQNFLFQGETSQFILKISNIDEEESVIEMQNQAMQWVQSTSQVVPTLNGKSILKYKDHLVRLIDYIPGLVMARLPHPTMDLFFQLGQLIGQTDQRLASFHHPAAKRDLYWDIRNARRVIEKYQHFIIDPTRRRMVERILQDWIDEVVPVLPSLRMSIVHNDANDYNIIIDQTADRRRIHLIDFGDMCYSYTVSDVAIACAYAMLDKSNPVEVAEQIVRGYREVFPLEVMEMKCLPYFILIRLSMSVTISAHQKSLQPDNEYLQISEIPAWNLLQQLQNGGEMNFSAFYESSFIQQK